jgi:hypothetical protein
MCTTPISKQNLIFNIPCKSWSKVSHLKKGDYGSCQPWLRESSEAPSARRGVSNGLPNGGANRGGGLFLSL